MSTLKTGALRGTSGTADSLQLHASNQSVTFPGAVTITGALTSSTTSLGGLDGVTTGSGNVTISDGDLVIGTSGHGISFAATSDASGTGVAMTNELLDDYEEGTWEPVLKAGGNAVTHSSKQGFYTKIGNLVYAWWNTVWTDLGSASGSMEMHGFPFTARSNSGQFYYVGHISTSGWTVNSYDDVTDQLLLTGNNTSAICGYQTGSGNQLQASEMNSSSRMWGNITYLAN